MPGTMVRHSCNVLYTVSTHFVLCTAPAGRYYDNLNLWGKRAWITGLKYAVSGGTWVWIQKAPFGTRAHNRCTVLSLSGCQWFSKSRTSFPISQQLINSSPVSGETAPRKLSHWVRRENAWLASPFLSPPLPLREPQMCRIRKWLWKKHMELRCEKNGKGLRLNFFFSIQYTVKIWTFPLSTTTPHFLF